MPRRLRLLRGADNLDDYVAEVPPYGGTLLAFKRSDKSWHGHKPISGQRRAIQLNWVTNQAVVDHEHESDGDGHEGQGHDVFVTLPRPEDEEPVLHVVGDEGHQHDADDAGGGNRGEEAEDQGGAGGHLDQARVRLDAGVARRSPAGSAAPC